MMMALLAEAAHHAHEASWWTEYLELLTNKAHVAFELTYEFITGVVLYPIAKWFWTRAVKRHDEEVHGHN